MPCARRRRRPRSRPERRVDAGFVAAPADRAREAARDAELLGQQHRARVGRPPQDRLLGREPGKYAVPVGVNQPFRRQRAAHRQQAVRLRAARATSAAGTTAGQSSGARRYRTSGRSLAGMSARRKGRCVVGRSIQLRRCRPAPARSHSLDRGGKARVDDVVQGPHRRRHEAAQQLVLALGAGLEAREPCADAVARCRGSSRARNAGCGSRRLAPQ